MSELSQQRWISIEKILRETLDQPPGSRAAFLAEACHEDEALRAEVQSLLDSHAESDGFLEVPAINLAARTLAAEKQSLIGSEIGPYRIQKMIGAGGMGEVYLAQDKRLGRQIAIKILPSEYAADPARVHRFQQEARAAGSLNHPNVFVIHDVGINRGLPYIASEFLHGESLREHLSRGKPALSKTLDIAIQTARGLAAAHMHGIVHRDLKPENIFITSDGQIKILDFGIAKLTESSPTAEPSLTNPGMILGTVGYLSPEQVRGESAGPSSDLFSFGCVLYEMLSGNRAFAKETPAETMAAILREEPSELADLAQVPPLLIRILRHCLEKSSSERFQSARDLAFSLENVTSPGVARVTNPKTPRLASLPWWLAAAFAVATIGLSVSLFSHKPSAPALLRFEIPIPDDPTSGSPSLAISPDGKNLAFMAMGPQGKPILWARALDAADAHPVPASEDSEYPFWSADSRYVAFHKGDQLRSLEVSSGAEQILANVRGVVSGSWNQDGVIIIGTASGPLLRLRSDGEAPVAVTKLSAQIGERSHVWPTFLPDNRHFIFSVVASSLDRSGVFVASLDNPEPKPLITGVNTNAAFVAPGYLLYARQGTVIARPFDSSSLRFTGREFPVADKVRLYYGYTAFSASQNGTVVFRPSQQSRFQLVWFDRSGKRLGPIEDNVDKKWSESLLPLSPVLSPDATQLAMVQFQPSNGAYGIWVASLVRNLQFPVTDIRNAEYAVWSPDGRSIAYSASPSGGARDIFMKRLDETGIGKLVYHSATDKRPVDWSPDGRDLLFLMNDPQGHAGLWFASLGEGGPSAVTPVSGVPADVMQARLSPDGRWLAYAVEEFGSAIVYVQDFPNGVMRVPVSEKGASDPQWSHDGRELFYLSAHDDLESVSIRENPNGGLTAGVSKVLFKTPSVGAGPYTVTPDGQRFLIQAPTENNGKPAISVLVNRF